MSGASFASRRTPTKGFPWPVKTETKFLRRQGEKRPLSPPLAQALTDTLLARGISDGGEPLVVNGSGWRWTRTHLTETMARLGKAAGINRPSVSAHKLRHTANVLARVAGIDPLTRSRIAHPLGPPGPSPLKTTSCPERPTRPAYGSRRPSSGTSAGSPPRPACPSTSGGPRTVLSVVQLLSSLTFVIMV
jgi:hypothetical protein